MNTLDIGCKSHGRNCDCLIGKVSLVPNTPDTERDIVREAHTFLPLDLEGREEFLQSLEKFVTSRDTCWKERVEAERWRCAGIVGNFSVSNPRDMTEERRINELLEEIQEDINDPEQMPIDDNGKFITTPITKDNLK